MKSKFNLSANSAQYLIINEDHQEQRIDNFLYNLFNKQIPRALIFSLIRTGQVRVNSGRIKPDYRLHLDDKIRIPPIKFKIESASQDPSAIKKIPNQHLKFWQQKINNAIVFENPYLLVVNKPAKLAVHGGSNVSVGLIEVLRSLRPQEHFLELVHRLDKETSGCIMIAKKRSYLKKLHLLLRDRKITKIYSALVKGTFSSKQVVELPLKKIIKNSKEHFVKLANDGSYAKTVCLPERCFKTNKHTNLNSSLIIAKPLTGKTHQIRVHLAEIGFPIANDDKYGDREYNSSMQKFGLNKMFLHARRLEFICPQTNECIVVNAELDPDLTNFLSKLSTFGEHP